MSHKSLFNLEKIMFSLGVPFMATFPYSSAVWARVE